MALLLFALVGYSTAAGYLGAFPLDPEWFCALGDNLRTDASTTTRAMQ